MSAEPMLDFACHRGRSPCADVEDEITDNGRVVTANLPNDLVSQMEQVAQRIDRSKSWIVRQAVTEWLAEENRRYELTLEALKSVDEGRVLSQDEIDRRVLAKRKPRSDVKS